jgi:alkanesulfonate monooxygenase SsuD/methylene tetrahydromethanopterin reductase-like flavin-dependent oxidoreductase (luciferase family)
MREYVGIVRAILRGEDPPQGEKFQCAFHFMAFEPRPDIPIYLAGLSPGMLRLAGEIADGVVLWLCNPDYIREVVVPTVAEGRAKAGKPAEGFDIVAAVPSAVTGEPDQARGQLRSDLIPYFSLPFYRKMIELSGYDDDIAAFDAAGADPAKISDGFIDTLAAIGSAEDAIATVRRYADSGASSPCLGGIAKTDFDATLEALAGSLG